MNSLKIDKQALEMARRQFCLDIGLPWKEYLREPGQKAYIRKAVYKEGTRLNDVPGARNYEGRDDFFHAMICLGQLFLVVDEQIYDWAVEKFAGYPVEWFCEYGNLRRIDEKLREFGHQIKDTHVYFLPETGTSSCSCQEPGQEMPASDPKGGKCSAESDFLQEWYDQQEILEFRESNRFTSAICFSKTQPDMLAVAAIKNGMQPGKHNKYDQSRMQGMAGVSADGEYLWQIGINVVKEFEGRGLATDLVRTMKEAVVSLGKTPFYGTSESHTISQTVGLKAGFVPAWTEVYAMPVSKEV